MQLFMIGYRGCGKSTVGRRLAQLLNRRFVDTDDQIEQRAGLSIQQIFASEGEAGFRDREEQAISECAKQDGLWVIALGGGAILRDANQNVIRNCGKSIWLRGSAQELYQRIHQDPTTADRRPNLSAGGGYDEVLEILTRREPIYRELADLTIDTEGRVPDEIAEEIAAWARLHC